jgi:hypothetical protein
MSDPECLIAKRPAIDTILKDHECISVPMHLGKGAVLRSFVRCALIRFNAFPVYDGVHDGVALYRDCATGAITCVYVIAIDSISCLERLATAVRNGGYTIVSHDGRLAFPKVRSDHVCYHRLENVLKENRSLAVNANVIWRRDQNAINDMITDLKSEFRMAEDEMSTNELERRLRSSESMRKLTDIQAQAATFRYAHNNTHKPNIYAAIMAICNHGTNVEGGVFVALVHHALTLMPLV